VRRLVLLSGRGEEKAQAAELDLAACISIRPALSIRPAGGHRPGHSGWAVLVGGVWLGEAAERYGTAVHVPDETDAMQG
jgi:hypothetical protein